MKTAAAALLGVALAFQTSHALADADESVARARFTSSRTSYDIGYIACNLVGAAQIGGRSRPFDMRVEDRRCSATTPMADDALAVRVHVEAHEVTVEMDASEAVSIDEARTTVTDVARELEARLAVPARPLYPPAVGETEPRRADQGLYTFGIVGVSLGAVGLGGGLVVGLGSLVVEAVQSGACGFAQALGGSGCTSNVSTGLIAAGVMLGAGAALMITGVVSMSIGGQRKVTAYATPSGGGLRVTF